MRCSTTVSGLFDFDLCYMKHNVMCSQHVSAICNGESKAEPYDLTIV